MAEMPVSTGSAGGSRRAGLSGEPATGAVLGPWTGGPPSTGSPRPLQTRPSQPEPDGDAQRLARRTTPGCVPARARRCPRAPGRPRGPGPPRGPARAAAGVDRVVAGGDDGELVPADAAHAAEDEQRPAHLVHAGVLDGEPQRAVARLMSAAPSVSSIAVAARADRVGVVGPALLGRAEQRRVVDLLDLGGGDPARRRAPRSGRRPRAPRRARAAVFAAAQWASFVDEGALLEHPLAQQPAGEEDDPLVAGERPGPDELGEVAEPVGLGEQPGDPGPAARPVRVAGGRVPGPDAVGVPGERARPSPPPGSAARRRGRGRGSTGVRTNRSVCAVTGSVRSPPGGETAPMIVTDASAPPRVLDPAGPLVERRERRGQRRRGSPPRPAARRSARRTPAAPRPSARSSRR